MDPNWQKAGYWKRAEVMESYQQTIKERCALIKDMHMNWSSARVLSDSMEKIPNNELISSIARFHNYIIFCEEHASVELLMVNHGDDARGLVVAKHVHLWLRLECRAGIGSLGCGSCRRGAPNLEPRG